MQQVIVKTQFTGESFDSGNKDFNLFQEDFKASVAIIYPEGQFEIRRSGSIVASFDVVVTDELKQQIETIATDLISENDYLKPIEEGV